MGGRGVEVVIGVVRTDVDLTLDVGVEEDIEEKENTPHEKEVMTKIVNSTNTVNLKTCWFFIADYPYLE